MLIYILHIDQDESATMTCSTKKNLVRVIVPISTNLPTLPPNLLFQAMQKIPHACLFW